MNIRDYLHSSATQAAAPRPALRVLRPTVVGSVTEELERMQRRAMGISNAVSAELAAFSIRERAGMDPFGTVIDSRLKAWRKTVAFSATSLGETLRNRALGGTTRFRLGTTLDGVSAFEGVISHLERTLQPFRHLRTVLDGIGTIVFPPPRKFAPLCKFLLARSWYIPLDAPVDSLLTLSELHDEGSPEEIEARLAHFVRESLDETERALITRFPNRKHLLEPAFSAHRRGEFALSVPALLSQADGISNALWQNPFFCSQKSISKVREQFERLSWDVDNDPWLSNLLERGSLRAHTSSLLPTDDTMNRHAVLHGLRTDWNTEVNSLKCVALLQFIASTEWIFADDAKAA